MGDETTNLARPATSKPSKHSTPPRTARFWRAMLDMIGPRWTETYGEAPSQLWTSAIEAMTDAQLKTVITRVMRSGTAFPPTLPEIVAYATRPAATTDTFVPAPQCSEAELLANRWFMFHAVRQRFAGIDNPDHELRTLHAAQHPRDSLEQIRERATEICAGHLMLVAEQDPAATKERLLGFLDAMAEEIYPAEKAQRWLAAAAA